jgi:hypothetical protein
VEVLKDGGDEGEGYVEPECDSQGGGEPGAAVGGAVDLGAGEDAGDFLGV